MQYLNTQIYDQAGITTADNFGITDVMLNDMATQAFRVIVNRVKAYNPDKLSFFSYETALTNGSGKSYTDLASNIILDCERARGDFRYPCEYMPWQLAERTKNVHTVDYRTKYDPIWTEKDGKVYIIPDPSTNESGYIHHVKFADIVTTTVTNVNATATTTFPIELDTALIKYCVVQVKIRVMNKLMSLAQDEWEGITGTAVVVSEAFTSKTSFTFTHNIGQMPGIVILDGNRKEISGELLHAADFLSVAVTFAVAQSGTIYAMAKTSSGGDLDGFEDSLPTWTSPTVPSMPTVPTSANLTALTNAIPTYSDVDFTGIVSPALSSQLASSVPSISALTATVADLSTTRIVFALNRASDFLDVSNADGSTDSVTIDTHSKITSHDVALANEATKAANAYTQTAAQEIALETAKMQSVSEDIKHIIGEFNGNIQAYQTRVNGAISEYQAQIQDYTADITKMVQTYAQESGSDVAKFTAEFNYLVQKFNAEIQSDIAIYSADVQAVIGEYSALVNAMAQEFSAGMSKSMAYLQSAQIRLQIGNSYTSQMQALPNEIALLSAQFENEVRMFCGLQPQTQKEG